MSRVRAPSFAPDFSRLRVSTLARVLLTATRCHAAPKDRGDRTPLAVLVDVDVAQRGLEVGIAEQLAEEPRTRMQRGTAFAVRFRCVHPAATRALLLPRWAHEPHWGPIATVDLLGHRKGMRVVARGCHAEEKTRSLSRADAFRADHETMISGRRSCPCIPRASTTSLRGSSLSAKPRRGTRLRAMPGALDVDDLLEVRVELWARYESEGPHHFLIFSPASTADRRVPEAGSAPSSISKKRISGSAASSSLRTRSS